MLKFSSVLIVLESFSCFIFFYIQNRMGEDEMNSAMLMCKVVRNANLNIHIQHFIFSMLNKKCRKSLKMYIYTIAVKMDVFAISSFFFSRKIPGKIFSFLVQIIV